MTPAIIALPGQPIPEGLPVPEAPKAIALEVPPQKHVDSIIINHYAPGNLQEDQVFALMPPALTDRDVWKMGEVKFICIMTKLEEYRLLTILFNGEQASHKEVLDALLQQSTIKLNNLESVDAGSLLKEDASYFLAGDSITLEDSDDYGYLISSALRSPAATTFGWSSLNLR